METQETKKETITCTVSKNAIIIGLAVALVLVSAIAIGMSFDEEENDGYDDNERGRMENYMGNKGMKYDDNDVNPNDGEYPDDVVPIGETPVSTTPVAGQAQ